MTQCYQQNSQCHRALRVQDCLADRGHHFLQTLKLDRWVNLTLVIHHQDQKLAADVDQIPQSNYQEIQNLHFSWICLAG